MFLFIHCQITLSVIFYWLFLAVQHSFFHWHKLADCICFESIEQMFQPVSEMLSIFIYNLRQYLSFSRLLAINPWLLWLRLLIYILFEWMLLWDDIVLNGFWTLWELGMGKRACIWVFFPSSSKFIKIFEVGLVDKLTHVHLNSN